MPDGKPDQAGINKNPTPEYQKNWTPIIDDRWRGWRFNSAQYDCGKLN
jgi:hypothetical protein